MVTSLPVLPLSLVIAALGLCCFCLRNARVGWKYPPGPKGLPILGNIFQLPGQHLATYFRNLVREHDGLVFLNIVGARVLIVGNMETAKDILDKRGAKFSSRPPLPYISKYVDPTGAYWAFHGQTEDFYVARRLTASVMSSVRTGLTEPLQQFEALLTVKSILDNERDWDHHIDRLVISSAFAIQFGAHFPTGDEPELQEALFAVSEVSTLGNFTASVINFLPFLDWIPGPMPWRTRANRFLQRERAFYSKMVHEAVFGRASDVNTWAAEFAKGDTDHSKPSRFMSIFASAAFDTTRSSIKSFVLACLLYPEWVARAREELDTVVGVDRMPTFADRPHLLYIEAAVRETLRWRPPVRTGLPHTSTEDDTIVHEGKEYFIPAGTIVFGLTWAIEHDPGKYIEPDRFNPNRYLEEDGSLRKKYETSAFGFGRRVWTFDIKKSDTIDPKTGHAFLYDASDAAFYGDLANGPHKFPTVFTPRMARHEEVARRHWEECEKNLNVLLPAHKTSH